MALTDGEGMNTTMLVSPTGGYMGNNGGFGNGFGGDWAWIILLLLLGWGNNGNGFGGGFGGSYGAEYPWLANGQQNIMTNTNNGFRDQMINDGITSIRDGIGNLQTQLCNCCGDVQMSLANGFANEVDQLYNRLSNCPVPTTPVYGRTPIFTCNNGNGCGCGCSGGF